MVENEASAKGRAASSYSWRPAKVGGQPTHHRRVRRHVEPCLQLEQLCGQADVALLREDGRRDLLVQQLNTRPIYLSLI